MANSLLKKLKPKLTIICDIDGTIADHSKRYKKAGKIPSRKNSGDFLKWVLAVQQPNILISDPVICNTFLILKALVKTYKAEIIYLTGREEYLRPITRAWLLLNKFPEGKLIMRPNFNRLKPSEFKIPVMLKIKTAKKNIIVLDDDNENDCLNQYKKHKFYHLKVNYG